MPCLNLPRCSGPKQHLYQHSTRRLRAYLFDKWERRLSGIFAANRLWVSGQRTRNHYKCGEIIRTAEPGPLWSACSPGRSSLQHFLQAHLRDDATKHKIPEAVANALMHLLRKHCWPAAGLRYRADSWFDNTFFFLLSSFSVIGGRLNWPPPQEFDKPL